MTAVTGGIGLDSNFLEINSSFSASGVLTATALLTIRIVEVLGNLNVNSVISQTAHVTLATVSGAILDRNPTTFIREGRVVDVPNVQGVSIDLDANGGGIGEAGNDLDIDSRTTSFGPILNRAAAGRVYLEADGNIFLTETNRELNLLAAESFGGLVRLTTPDTGAGSNRARRAERHHARRRGPVPAPQRQQAAQGEHALPVPKGRTPPRRRWRLIGDSVATNDNSEIVAGTTITIRGDNFRNGDVPEAGMWMSAGTNMDLARHHRLGRYRPDADLRPHRR
jgi:hypothetical protein